MSYKIVSQHELVKMIEKTKKGEGYTLLSYYTTGPCPPNAPVIGVCLKGVGYFTSKEDAYEYAQNHPKTTTKTIPTGKKSVIRHRIPDYNLPENREYEFCPVFGLKLKSGGGFTAVYEVEEFDQIEVQTLAGKIMSS